MNQQLGRLAHACMWATGIRKLKNDSVCFYKNAGWAISEILQFPDVNADKIWYDIRYEISNRRNCGKTKQLPGQDNETAGDRNEREN